MRSSAQTDGLQIPQRFLPVLGVDAVAQVRQDMEMGAFGKPV